MWTLTLHLLTLVFLVMLTRHGLSITFSHVRFVDHSPDTGNFLFRSGDPSNSSSGISYETLISYFALRAKEVGLTFPRKFLLLDLSFWTTETEQMEKERQFFKDNPNLGEVIFWPITSITEEMVDQGCEQSGLGHCFSIQPATYPPPEMAILAPRFLKWGDLSKSGSSVSVRVGLAHHWLTETNAPLPLVIFGHCTCGCDRTGAFFGAYYMRYQNRSFTETMRYSEGVPNRHLEHGMQVYVQWYCEYLHRTMPMKYPALTDCLNCRPFICDDVV